MSNTKPRLGRLYGVGVGPGDPELITLKAQRVLSRVPVVFVPLKDRQSKSYAKSIIADFISDDQEVVELVLPMLRDKKQLAAYWQQAVDTIWRYLKKGRGLRFREFGRPPSLRDLCSYTGDTARRVTPR